MIIRLACASAALLLATTGVASAAPTFKVSSGKLSSSASSAAGNLGTLTGTFMTNAAMSAITSFDFIASAAAGYSGFEYTSANSTVSAATLPSQYFQITSNDGMDMLRVYFASALTASGTTIAPAFTFETESGSASRFVSGSIVAAATAVPEPAGWTMMIFGVAAVGYSMRRRKRTNPKFALAI